MIPNVFHVNIVPVDLPELRDKVMMVSTESAVLIDTKTGGMKSIGPEAMGPIRAEMAYLYRRMEDQLK